MKQVVIIGAGPAGLTAALDLLDGEQSCEVCVLEASNVIGGISQTVRHGGNRMDIGGHRFFSKNTEVMNKWAQIMPLQGAPSFDDIELNREKPLAQGGPNPETEDRVMLVRERVSRIYYKKNFFDYPISMKPQTIKNMGLLTTMKAGFSYLASAVHKRPETNLENFYINRFGKVLYSMFFEGYTEKLWGRHPKEISADWGAQRVKGLSILKMLQNMLTPPAKRKKVETSLIEQFWYPKYGPGQLWETVADDIKAKGGKVLMNHDVKRIICENNKITAVVCQTENGEVTIEADEFISSMPVRDLVLGMSGEGAPNENAVRIANGLPYRDFVTVGLLVNKLNLKNETDKKTLNNIVPDCWIYVQDTDVKLGRIQIFNNWSPYMVKDPHNTVWIGLEYFCTEGDEFWEMADDANIKFAIDELVKMGIISNAGDVLDSHRERVKKAYPAYFDTYSEIDTLTDTLDTYKNLWCVGRNGQHRYNNMDHSMLTAMKAAEAIKQGKTDKSILWNINTEKEYHEEK